CRHPPVLLKGALNSLPGQRPLHCGIPMWPLSALGHERTKRHHAAMSVLPPKADKWQTSRDVRFVPKGDIRTAADFSYSITSSARADSPGGTSSLRVLAVLRLITNSNLVA